MRFAFIAKHRHIWPVSWLCDALEVSRSGLGAHVWLFFTLGLLGRWGRFALVLGGAEWLSRFWG